MKLLLLNNYDIAGIAEKRRSENDDAPAQHLWGYHLLAAHDIDADILAFNGSAFLKSLGDRLKIFGDLDQQWRLLRRARTVDIVYSGQFLTTPLYALGRRLGLVKTPIVAIAYQSPRGRSRFWKFYTRNFLGGHDRIMSLSKAVIDDLIGLGVPEEKLSLIGWGVDLAYYTPAERPRDGAPVIVSAGKTHRDFPTLLGAFDGIDCPLKIFGAGSLKSDAPGLPFGPNVTVIETMISWQTFIDEFRDAYAIAIPLDMTTIKFHNAIGLTALTEAMAVGKPVIMTRNDYVGIDIEKEGIGIWVDEGDIDGWRRAVTALIADPEKADAMGKKARALAEAHYNIDRFTATLADVCRDVVSDR